MKKGVKLNGIDTNVDIDLVPTEADGRPIKNLLDTMTDGVYDVDTVEEAKLAKATSLSNINTWYEGEVDKLTKGIPNTERDTWTKQEAEANMMNSWFNTPETLEPEPYTPFIDNLALQRGVDKAYLVTKIIEKADAYAIAVGTLTGERQRREDELAVS